MMRIYLLLLFISFQLFAWDSKSEEYEKLKIEKEIEKYEKDILELNSSIEATEAATTKEKLSQQQYLNEIQKEIVLGKKQQEQAENEKRSLTKSSDSLSRVVSKITWKRDELKLKQKKFSKAILKELKVFVEKLALAPVEFTDKQRKSALYLQNELASGSIDNGEAVERLWQITEDLTEQQQIIDVWNGSSTCDSISGTVHFLRFGYGYLACVNEEATKGAIWYEDSWMLIDSPKEITAIRNAVKIRNGNMVPEIIGLPIKYRSEKDEVLHAN